MAPRGTAGNSASGTSENMKLASTNVTRLATVFDAQGRLVAQAAHIPVHLGSAGDAVAAARAAIDFADGDVAVLNDPYQGGTHLPDVTMVRPVFESGRERPSWFVVDRAHHADIGGATPGSMGIAGS